MGGAVIKAGHRQAQIHLGAGFQHGAAVGLSPEIHIGGGDHAEAQHFRHGQQSAVVNVLIREPGLKGEHLFIQPVGQGQIFRIPAQKRHG